MVESCMQPRITICSTGKKAVKSRCGVIHSCMVDMHSKVPCILHIPSTKHKAHSNGSSRTCGATRLQTSAPAAAAVSSVRFVKRNFMRKSIGKYIAMPARLA